MGKRIVFLDIDGVLNNRAAFDPGKPGGSKRISPECVEALNWITATSHADIVVSSTWRTNPNIVAVLADAGVTGKIHGVTPQLTRRKKIAGRFLHVSAPRGEEIQAWITYNGPVDHFVILDDDADMEHLMGRLVQTNFDEGLTMEHAKRALILLTDVAHA